MGVVVFGVEVEASVIWFCGMGVMVLPLIA